MARNRYHEHLRSIPLFEGLDVHELDAVGRATTELELPAGRELIREGGRDRDVYVVVSGTLDVTRGGVHVAEVGAGEFVGEMALLTGGVRNAEVAVASDAVVLHVDGRALGGILDGVPRLAAKMLPVVARRAADNDSVLVPG